MKNAAENSLPGDPLVPPFLAQGIAGAPAKVEGKLYSRKRRDLAGGCGIPPSKLRSLGLAAFAGGKTEGETPMVRGLVVSVV